MPAPWSHHYHCNIFGKGDIACKEQGGLAEPSCTEFLALKQKVERLELELAQKDEEHQAEIMSATVKLQNAFSNTKNPSGKVRGTALTKYHVQSLIHQMKLQIKTAQHAS